MRILPFKIAECKALLDENGVRFSDRELIESYMVFGGIPYYLNLLSPSLSLSQNVQRLCFEESGDLRHEHIEEQQTSHDESHKDKVCRHRRQRRGDDYYGDHKALILDEF